MRREQRVDLQPGEQLLVALDAHVDEHHRIMRVADDLAGEAVATLAVAIAHAHSQRVRVDVLELVSQIPPLFMEKRLAIGDEKLHVANLRAIDRGAVDLVQDAVRHGEPDFAGGGIGGAHRVFGAGGPARLKPGRAKGSPDRRAICIANRMSSVSHSLCVIPGLVLAAYEL